MQCRHSKMRENIEHEGIITNIRDGAVDVQIVQYSACSNCHAQSACTMSDKKEKMVEIPCNNDMDFKIGDKVLIIGNSAIGPQAILIAFLAQSSCNNRHQFFQSGSSLFHFQSQLCCHVVCNTGCIVNGFLDNNCIFFCML